MGGRLAGAGVGATVVALATAAVVAAGPTGSVELISKGNTPTPVTDRGSYSAISGDGRYVAFFSAGRDLDPTDTNSAEDIFVKDRQTGSLQRITKSYAGLSTNGASSLWRGALDADGSVIAFTSTASNIVEHDNNKVSDVFAYDKSTGQTELISVDIHDSDADQKSYDASVSPDGRYVVFTSAANDLVSGDDNGQEDVFHFDRQTGDTTLLSRNQSGQPASGQSGMAAISADGAKVAYASRADDIVLGDGNGKADVFVRDLASGNTERVSVSTAGNGGNGQSVEPFISGDGRYVGFASTASNLGGVKYNRDWVDNDMYIRDTATGKTSRIMPDVPSAAQWGDGTAWEVHGGTVQAGSISNDGRFVAFHTNSSDFGISASGNVLVLDRATGDYSLVSSSPQGEATGQSNLPQIAGDASAVSFSSRSQNLLPIGSTYNNQIFARPFSADSVPADIDGDGIANMDDNCQKVANPGQEDYDGEGRGNVCDFDDDSDLLVDPLEPRQNTDKLDEDTDGDGVGDEADDYPADASRYVGDEHETLNKVKFDTPDGIVLAVLKWDADTRTFEARLTGLLAGDHKYSLIVYRRSRYIREREACAVQTNATGLVSCSQGGLQLSFFTDIALVKDSNADLDPYAYVHFDDGADRDRSPIPGDEL